MLHRSKVISWILSPIPLYYNYASWKKQCWASLLMGIVTSEHTLRLGEPVLGFKCSLIVLIRHRISCNNVSTLRYWCQHPAQDCAVSDWSFWSGCAKPCQLSVRVRVRHIEQQPGNSGQPCPSLQEQAGCREYRDHQGRHCGLNSGICVFCVWSYVHIFLHFIPFCNSWMISLMRSCIHHQHGICQGKTQARQLWKPPEPRVGFI